VKRLVALAALAVALAGCSGPAQQGKVARWQYQPPTSQTVDASCDMWSGYSGGSGSGGGSGTAICLVENTAVEPEPQQCTLTLSDGATEDLNVPEQECRAYLGQQWPIGGSTGSASG
jgi:hypothetical protein